jgi:hypothetical protein
MGNIKPTYVRAIKGFFKRNDEVWRDSKLGMLEVTCFDGKSYQIRAS